MRATLRLGSRGADVVAWQQVIGVEPDGAFGPLTDYATRAWQDLHGLTVDGIVGPKTWAVAESTVPTSAGPTPRAVDGIWPSVAAAFAPFSVPLEGSVPWLYLDVRGLVTTAIGVLVDPVERALALPLVRPDGSPATREEIAAAWSLVKLRPELARQGHLAAERVTSLRLTPDGIESVTLAKLRTHVAALVQRFPELPTWPAPAQLAVLSLAWACGTSFSFPRLEAHLRTGAFSAAVGEVDIRSEGNPGVVPRNTANRKLLLEAAEACRVGRDPSVLLYPTRG